MDLTLEIDEALTDGEMEFHSTCYMIFPDPCKRLRRKVGENYAIMEIHYVYFT